ncbi:MAG: alpha/beta fold hydrolase [bacterium]|nr:alpha/beta fold hydrolase [bacterium]
MKAIEQKQLAINGSREKKITLDITLPVSKVKTPVVIFCHGFKGFKDWGHFNWVANEFAKTGLSFLKFNFSYNGTSESQLVDLSDMEAFANNNYTTELNDLGVVIDFIDKEADTYNWDKNEIYLIGHSRGGGIALLKASDDRRIKKLTLWASLSEFESFFRPETIAQWDKEGVVYAVNKRTGQNLPLNKQFYGDYLANKEKLDVHKAAKLLGTPLLIIHGDKDESVPLSHAEALYDIVQHSILIKVENGDHTFGAKHPFDEANDVTEMLEELVENTVEFFVD